MKPLRDAARPDGPRELTRIIRRHLSAQGEVVLATDELGEFHGNGHPLDSVRVQEIIREVADAQGWRAFVFDCGAGVRFSAGSETRSRTAGPAQRRARVALPYRMVERG